MAQNQQQLIIAEFIEKVKRDNFRKDDPYFLDDDSPITTNRGNKLNRNAKKVRRGKLNDGLFQLTVEHAGYKRDVISINPQYYTPEGDIVEDEEDIDEDDEPLEENIYKDIKLEEIFAPLTAASDLQAHPSLSRPYKDGSLDEMIANIQAQLHETQKTLVTMKQLQKPFQGDIAWAPPGIFQDGEADRILKRLQSQVDPHSSTNTSPGHDGENMEDSVSAVAQLSIAPGAAMASASSSRTNGIATSSEDLLQHVDRTDYAGAPSLNGNHINGNGAEEPSAQSHLQTIEHASLMAQNSDTAMQEDAESTNTNMASFRMTTRRQANQNTRTPSPVRSISPVSYVPPVDPFFEFPPEVLPDRNHGLPEKMAEETRYLLANYISKQELIVLHLKDLLYGLLRAKKMRSDVWAWTKAEGHVGEMSDNEDWVDLEEWGIDPRDTRIKYTKGQEEDQPDEEEERRGKRVRRAGRGKE